MVERKMTDLGAIHRGDRDATLRAISEQASELHEQEREWVTCPCGTKGPLRDMFKCFYCHVIFCPACAEEHFEDDDDGFSVTYKRAESGRIDLVSPLSVPPGIQMIGGVGGGGVLVRDHERAKPLDGVPVESLGIPEELVFEDVSVEEIIEELGDG